MVMSCSPWMMRVGRGHALVNAGRDTRAIEDWLGHQQDLAAWQYSESGPLYRNTEGAPTPMTPIARQHG
jgi:hypothetical protein